MPDQKRAGGATRFKALNFKVIAAGDSYNDTAMLSAADAGILFRPPQNVVARVPAVPGARATTTALRASFDAAAARFG